MLPPVSFHLTESVLTAILKLALANCSQPGVEEIMETVQEIEQVVAQMSEADLAHFRA